MPQRVARKDLVQVDDNLELSLIKYIHPDGKVTYHAVNDKHYDGMLAGGLSEEKYGKWDWLGDVFISEEILGEQGYFFDEKA